MVGVHRRAHGLVMIASPGITVANLGLGSGLTLFTGATLIIATLFDHFGAFADPHPFDV